MEKETGKKSKQENLTIPKKALMGIAPAIPILAILLSKNKPGEAVLFLIGIVLGVLIGKGFFEK